MKVELRGRSQDVTRNTFKFELRITHEYEITREAVASSAMSSDEFMTACFIQQFNAVWAEMANFNPQEISQASESLDNDMERDDEEEDDL